MFVAWCGLRGRISDFRREETEIISPKKTPAYIWVEQLMQDRIAFDAAIRYQISITASLVSFWHGHSRPIITFLLTRMTVYHV